MTEEWLPIPDWRGDYEVSSFGRVRRWMKTRKEYRVLNPAPGNTGYLCIALRRVSDGKRMRVSVHRLVATAFIGNPDALPTVRHLNDDKLDNRAANLAWGTQAENNADKVRNGRTATRANGRSRNQNADKTHCKYGHEFTPENTAIRDQPNGNRARRCRACRNASARVAA